MLAKIAETESKREQMLAAITSIEAAKVDMLDTTAKMKVLKEAVPKTFEEAKNKYLAEIDKLAPQIQSEFQRTLNEGFKQIYLTTGISAMIAMLILIFYRKKEYAEVLEPVS